MIDWRSIILAGVMLSAGCAANMTPEQQMAHEIFVQVASSCDLDGGLKVHADADSRTEYRPFVACYSDGLKAQAEERRKAGKPLYEGLMRTPDVELD
jgi:hypothetical protein